MKKELILASYGLLPEQVTLETVLALKECDKVLFTTIDQRNAQSLVSFCRAYEFVSKYGNEELLEYIFKTSGKCGKLGIVHNGDPGFLCSLAEPLRKFCKKKGIGFKTYRAVSSLSALIEDLGLSEPDFNKGLVVLTLNEKAEPQLRPANPTLIYCAASAFDSSKISARFIKAMRAVYSAEHEVVLIKSSCLANRNREIIRTKVGDLAKTIRLIDGNTTLFIPPRKNK